METINLNDYDYMIVAFSGGKDSLACFLYLLELGVSKSKIELWHHLVDGREGSTLMDWPITEAYVRAIATAFEIPLYFSWKEGGFEREMLRNNINTAPILFETPDGIKKKGGDRNSPGTRLKFPQVAADLKTRWCSAYLKIGVFGTAIANQDRFLNKKTLVITGERAEESTNRAKYKQFEPHGTMTKKRYVMQWRPVLQWACEDVWEIIETFKVSPHPAYRISQSIGRVSCARCIFGSANQLAIQRAIAPKEFKTIVDYETQFGVTVKRKGNYDDNADKGIVNIFDWDAVKSALSTEWNEPIFLKDWQMPVGAFGDSSGPT